MKNITISQKIKRCCPLLRLGCIEANIKIEEHVSSLWDEINMTISNIHIKTEQIKTIAPIHASREAYKAMGKEPSRYRLSAEALLRRIAQNKGLYQINNVVDIINITSIKSGYSIGGYDADKIQGEILLDSGRENDIYEAIGRGILNIENLPVFRDKLGAFGSPTSDSIRTMITEQTQNILLVFLDFDKHFSLLNTIDDTIEMLKKYAEAQNYYSYVIA